jgi:hypothetical protein
MEFRATFTVTIRVDETDDLDPESTDWPDADEVRNAIAEAWDDNEVEIAAGEDDNVFTGVMSISNINVSQV